MTDTVDYNAGLHPQYSTKVPKSIVEEAQKKGFPSPYDELEEVSDRAIKFYKSEGDMTRATEIEEFRNYLLDTEGDNF